MLHPFTSSVIPLVIMACSFETANNVNPVGPFLDRPQKVYDIDLSGTGQSDDFNACRIIESHGTCQVRGGISSVITTKC
jgi:hypothetical protein